MPLISIQTECKKTKYTQQMFFVHETNEILEKKILQVAATRTTHTYTQKKIILQKQNS